MIFEYIKSNASIIIALCTLAFTFWQVIVTRKHNKISVSPKLVSWQSTSLDKGYFSVLVINNGLGPALINKFEIYVDNVKINCDGEEPIIKALNLIFPNQQYNSTSAYVTKGFSLNAKEQVVVTQVQFSKLSLTETQFKHAIKRAKLIIEYESFYGEKHILDTSKEGKI